ncbi:retrotransposon protein, putative, unclassified [Tanacetum coccineum]
MKRGFLSQKGSGGGRGVKEKQSLMADNEKSGVEPSANKDGVAPSVNGDGDSENAGQTCPNSASDGVVASPPISTPNPGKSSSYANITGKPSRTKVSFLTLFTPVGNGIDVVVLWHPDVNLLKEYVGNVPVWVKLHDVLVTAFSEDGLSAIATKLGTPLMLDSYTFDMCMQSWSRCAYCKVFGHFQEECPKNIGAGETKNLKKPSQTPIGVPIGQKVGFKSAEQVYQPVSKKPNVNTNGPKKKNMELTKEVSKSNLFDVLTSVENDVDFGTNEGTSNLASQEANSSGSLFWNVISNSLSTTLIIEKIDKIEKLIIDGKVTLVDDEGKPLEKVESLGDYDSEDEVASVDNKMASFFARKDGYGTNSLLEQWKESYKNDDYDYDPYDDDMYEVRKFLISLNLFVIT